MKKLLLSAVLAMSTSVATAGVVFELQDQYFSETLSELKGGDGPMVPAQYDLGDLVVKTNLSRWHNGQYSTINKRNDGYFIAEFKQPLANWAISLGADFGFRSCSQYDSSSAPLKLLDSAGNELILTVKACKLTMRNNSFATAFNGSYVTINLRAAGDKIYLSHNGVLLQEFPRADFGHFKYLEIPVGDKYSYFKISNLIISD